MIRTINPDDGDFLEIGGGTRLQFFTTEPKLIVDSDRQYFELAMGLWGERNHSDLNLWWNEGGTVVLMFRSFDRKVVRLDVTRESMEVLPLKRSFSDLWKGHERWLECRGGVILVCEGGLTAFDEDGRVLWRQVPHIDFYVSDLDDTSIEVHGMNWGPIRFGLRGGEVMEP